MAPLIPLLTLLFGSKLFQGKQTADRLEYFPKNLELIHGKLVYTMEVLNPTSNKLKVDSFFGNILADDKKVGSIEQGDGFTLAAKTRTSVSLPIRLNALGAVKTLLSGKKLQKMKWKIAGIAKALGINNPVIEDLSFNV